MKRKLKGWIRVMMAMVAISTTITACGGMTQTTVDDEAKAYTGPPMGRIMVIGVANNMEDRRLFETTFANCLKAQGVMAQSSLVLMPDDPRLDKERVKRVAEQHDLEAVLVTRLVGVEEQTERYRSGFRKRGRVSVHRSFGDYSPTLKRNTQSGYYVQRRIVRLETNLYEVASEALIWTVLSESMAAESVADLTQSVCETIVTDMRRQGLIK